MDVSLDVRVIDAIIDTKIKDGMEEELGKDAVKAFDKMSEFLNKYGIHGQERFTAYVDLLEVYNEL